MNSETIQMLSQIFELCIIPLLGVLTSYLVKYIQAKSSEISAKTESEKAQQYIKMLSETITECVKATNQTYVDSLKNQNAFTKEAQEEAFVKTFNTVKIVLSEEAKKYLATIYGDLDAFIIQQIEATVKKEKLNLENKE